MHFLSLATATLETVAISNRAPKTINDGYSGIDGVGVGVCVPFGRVGVGEDVGEGDAVGVGVRLGVDEGDGVGVGVGAL